MGYGSIANQTTEIPPIPEIPTSKLVNATLTASSWRGSSAPYTYNLTVTGVTANTNQDILPGLNISASQLEQLQAANIQDGGQTTNRITLKAFGEKPTSNLPIRVIIRGIVNQ